MKQITRKKSLSLAEAFPAVSAVALVGVFIVVLIYLFGTMQTGMGSTNSRTTLSENVASVTTIGVAVANSSNCNFGNFAVVSAINTTGGMLITSSNYTTTANGVIRYIGPSGLYNNTAWTLNYTYTDGGNACIAAGTTSTQFISVIPLVGLVLVIVLIGIVIGVLIYSFVGGRQKA